MHRTGPLISLLSISPEGPIWRQTLHSPPSLHFPLGAFVHSGGFSFTPKLPTLEQTPPALPWGSVPNLQPSENFPYGKFFFSQNSKFQMKPQQPLLLALARLGPLSLVHHLPTSTLKFISNQVSCPTDPPLPRPCISCLDHREAHRAPNLPSCPCQWGLPRHLPGTQAPPFSFLHPNYQSCLFSSLQVISIQNIQISWYGPKLPFSTTYPLMPLLYFFTKAATNLMP